MKRQPVIVINGIITVIQTSLALLALFGVVSLSKEQIAGIGACAIAVGNIIGIVLTRNSVTPVSDPRDNQGRTLRPVQEAQPALQG